MNETNDLTEAFNQKYHIVAQEIERLFITLKSSQLNEDEKQATYVLLLKIRALLIDCINTTERQTGYAELKAVESDVASLGALLEHKLNQV